MKRNCYLDLRFRPSMNEPLNINKRVFAIRHNTPQYMFDVAEIQARVIIWLVSQEMNGGKGTATASSLSFLQSQLALLIHAPQVFSIKRSLRNFLQKRKKRTQKLHLQCNPQ
ncbi:hypothetical protein RJT34_00037 [Clitoria ternatea]|uniref:Uncharacterized protein n=1 Tax=Clitoria ternatea TaxID=43366 RepID=A0AAN9KG97_CLITE